MKARLPKYRVWDPVRKELGDVTEINYTNSTVKAIFTDGEQVANQNWVLMQNIELTDLRKRPIYEEDIVDFMFDAGVRGWRPVRGKVVWNPHISYGTYGFVIVDTDGSIHAFDNMDHMTVIGNSFLGITK